MERITQLVDSTITIVPRRFERDQVIRIVSITAATMLLYSSYKMVSSSHKKKQEKKSKGIKEIPSPNWSYPYFGHMLSLGKSPGQQIRKWHKEVGHIFKLRMGVQTWILIDDPVLAHKIFVSHGAESSHRPESTFISKHYSMNGKGVAFIQPNKTWQKARSAVLSIIAPKVVDGAFVKIINEETAALAQRLMDYSIASNEGVDCFKHLHLNSMNIIFTSGFGKRYKSIEDPEFLNLSDTIEEQIAMGALENDLANFLPVASIFDYFVGKEAAMKKFIDTRRNPIFRTLIHEAEQAEGTNLVKSLAEFDFEEDEKLVIMSDLIAGGTDTVSITLYWVFAIMCNYQDVQKRAASEIDEFIKINGRIPKFTERDQFPYIVSLLKECMRFRPTTPFGIPHTTDSDIVIDGYLIPKGSSIISSMESMHMNSEVYPEPERFISERFAHNTKTMLAAANGKLKFRDHYNFGWGRRTCPAIYLAEAELFLSFVQVLARCSIEAVKNSEGKEQVPDIETTVTSGLVLVPINYKVNFTARPDALI